MLHIHIFLRKHLTLGPVDPGCPGVPFSPRFPWKNINICFEDMHVIAIFTIEQSIFCLKTLKRHLNV